jgi:soluble lytic murein transglycosylase
MLIGNTDFFKPLSEPQIHRSFKEVKKFDLLAPLVKNVLSPKECPQATLAVALALRTEHFFPDESAQEQAIQLYERAITCDVKAPVSFKARFRLTLLYLWKKRPIDALPHLKVLTENPEYSEYHSRALYWGYDASKQTKDMDRAELYKSALLKRYPFSLHSILIWQDEALSKGNKNIEFDFSEPLLKMRSKSIPELNAPVRAVEALLFLDEVEAAKKILAPFEEEFEDAEVGFQLYAGLLYNRVGDFLNKFRILSNLFKTHPEMVSKASLTLFYPTKSLTAFSEVGFKLDPYLVLALIRQESAFNEKARSPAGAMGLMQLMPRTAYLVSRVKKNSLFNPDINVKVGSKYFSDLIDRFNGDVELALASYNAGPLRVDDWLSRYPADQRLLFLDLIPFQETREYVAAIARNYFWYHTLYIEGQSKTVEKPLFKVFDTSI